MEIISKFTVYGDFNCPFCFALNERLMSLEISDLIDWRMIEHAPLIDSKNFSVKEQSELADEVFTVRHRAPETTIALPPVRPNTGMANALLGQLMILNHPAVKEFRQGVYRALWKDGHDISEPRVLDHICLELGISTTLKVDSQVQYHLKNWKECWEKGAFERRIPAVLSNDQRVMLGLGSLVDIRAFFAGLEVPPVDAYACSFKQRPIICVVGDLNTLWAVVKPLRYHCDIRVTDTVKGISKIIDTVGQTDLILLDKTHIEESVYEFCLTFSQQLETSSIPIIIVDGEHNLQQELAAYECGVSDYVAIDIHSRVLEAKVKKLLQLKRYQDLLEKAARTDNLTQIYNRREFDRCLELEWKRAFRTQHPLSLLMIDIDYFKNYNDYYGHLAGDGCLRLIAQALKVGCHRATDIIARYGGEEFVVLMANTDCQGAKVVADELLQAVAKLSVPHADSRTGNCVSISVGVGSIVPSQHDNPRQLLSVADEYLYLAKGEGRNRVCLANTLQGSAP